MTDEEQQLRAIEAQKRLELMGVERGVQMYRAAERRAIERKGAGAVVDTTPGMKMMQAILPPFEAAILSRQKEGVEAMKKRGATPKWVLPMLSLSAAKLAFIAVRSVLSSEERKLTKLALDVGRRCQDEREYELFAEAERQRVKDGILSAKEQELGMSKPRNVVSLMREYAGEVNERTFKSWRKKADDWESIGWSSDDREHLGVQLLFDLVEHGGGWFEIRIVSENRPGRGRVTYRTLHMTSEGQAFIDHARSVDEVNRPWLTPMIIKPKRWQATT